MKIISFCLLSALMLASCGEFSYKRGASAQDLQATKRLCEASKNDDEVEMCLKKHGWSVHNFDKESLFAIPSITENNPSLNIVVDEKPVTATQADPTVNDSSTNTTQTTKAKTSKQKQEESPTKVYKLNSWWKLGGNPTTLNGHIKECADLLGEQHQPDMEKGLYTRALVICMHNKGWKPLLSPEQ